jgi:hypothetical protein
VSGFLRAIEIGVVVVAVSAIVLSSIVGVIVARRAR